MSDYIKALQHEIQQEQNIEGDLDNDEVAPARYDITSYGIDFDVDGVVKRIIKGDIFVPQFQRNFVWNMRESSRFVESLLLGLPVPGIFLAQEPETGKLLVIDGQQRLLSLKFFFEGFFNPKEGAVKKRAFKLTKVQAPYLNKTYKNLDERDRISLENCVIHATVVKQDSPSDDDTSIYHIFERLNSGGRKLTPQEIRTAVYHGTFIELLKELNAHKIWRKIFGPENDRMRDQELMLRFFAMLQDSGKYKKPMVDFLNRFLKNNRSISEPELSFYRKIFIETITLFYESVGPKVFRPARALNVATYEASMVGLAKRIISDQLSDKIKINNAYESLNNDRRFKELISQSTTDLANVTERLNIATNIFMEV